MTNLQRHNGFSFIEVILALFMIATLMTAVASLSQTSIINLFDFSGKLQRIFMLEETLFDLTFADLQHKPFKQPERSYDEAPTKLSYRKLPISDASSLKAFKDDLELYQVKAEWTSLYTPREETMIGIFFKRADGKK